MAWLKFAKKGEPVRTSRPPPCHHKTTIGTNKIHYPKSGEDKPLRGMVIDLHTHTFPASPSVRLRLTT